MGKTLDLEVATPERLVLKETIESIVVPGSLGSLGVLPNHAPLITGLQAGLVKYRREGEDKFLVIGSGLMEVLANKITILTERAQKTEGKKRLKKNN